MKIAVVGSRDYVMINRVAKRLMALKDEYGPGLVIVSGGARGIDSFAESWAKERNIPTIIFRPDWKKHGKGAGVIRNKLIVDEADKVIAFWDGKSRGTKDSIGYAKFKKKEIEVVMDE